MDPILIRIINYLKEIRCVDFSGYNPSTIERRIQNRLTVLKKANYYDYLEYIHLHGEELDRLIDVLTINVSRFFRKTLTFEYIADRILPAIISRKKATPDPFLRIWSAGCSTGEEPYSVAILLKEMLEKKELKSALPIFGTDIDQGVLRKAREGRYSFESVKNIKYYLLCKYFTIQKESYLLKTEIKDMVNFSYYDLLDRSTSAPSESVFGDFDLVLCRNVLIYYRIEYQDKIMEKLRQSLAPGGFLVLGEAEAPSMRYPANFTRTDDYYRIYQKTEC